MLAVLLALALQVPPGPLTASQADRARTQPLALAPQVLTPETLALVEGGRIWRVWIPGEMYQAQFWEASRPGPDGFCSRRVHGFVLGKPQVPGGAAHTPETLLAVKDLGPGVQYAVAWPRPATACPSHGYVTLPPETADADLAILTRLTDAMAQAEAGGPLPFELSCMSQEPAACEAPRSALAGLPLNALIAINLKSTRYRWELRDGEQVRLIAPASDGRPPEGEIAFGRSGDDGHSWTVTLNGADRLESVEMRRANITGH